ncbi:MAG: hypothetical protein V2A56_05965 [bacterium]
MKTHRAHIPALTAFAVLTILPTAWTAPPQAADPFIELKPLGSFGQRPKDVAAPGRIAAVTILADGGIAILDETAHRILLFGGDGSWRGEAGGFGFDSGALRSTGDLAAVGFELWASDPAADRIVRYDQWLAPLEPFTSVTGQDGNLAIERPVSAARSVQGDLIILEGDRSDGLLVDPEGRLVERVASFGQAGLALIQPRRVETVTDHGFAIADPGIHAAVLLDRFGTLRGLRPWKLAGEGPWGITSGNRRLWLCGEGGIVVLSETGSELGRWTREMLGGPVQDLALRGDRLYAAVDDKLLVFRIMDGGGR